jgi:hypothetical protein
MSKANITNTEKMPNGKVRLTFETDSGFMTYEYGGNSAKAINRGVDPANLVGGRLVEHRKKKQ